VPKIGVGEPLLIVSPSSGFRSCRELAFHCRTEFIEWQVYTYLDRVFAAMPLAGSNDQSFLFPAAERSTEKIGAEPLVDI